MNKIQKLSILFLIILFSSVANIFADESDSTLTIKPKDSIFIHTPSYNLGSNTNKINSDIQITKHNILFDNYLSLADLLQSKTDFMPIQFATFGMPSGFSVNGSSLFETEYFLNGRNLASSQFGQYNSSNFPVEFMEKAEIFIGSDAAILFGNTQAVSIQQIRYNTAKPYTRIWYGEAGLDYLSADGILSQNIAPNWNLTLGFHNKQSNGQYNMNQGFKLWNWRAALRYNFDSLTSIAITENFTSTYNELSGGIDPNKTSHTTNFSYFYPLYENLNERSIRNDFSITYTKNSSDSNSLLNSNFYLTTDRKIRYASAFSLDYQDTNSIFSIDNYFISTGLNSVYEFNYLTFDINTGADIGFYSVPNTMFNTEFSGLNSNYYILIAKPLLEKINISVGGRYNNAYGNSGINYGGKVSYNFTENNLFSLDYSSVSQINSPAIITSKTNISNTISGVYKYSNNNNFTIKIRAYMRENIAPVISIQQLDTNQLITNFIFENGADYSVSGGSVSLNYYNKIINATIVTGTNITSEEEKQGSYLPKFWSKFDVFYTYKRTKSQLRLGLKGWLYNSFKTFSYSPLRENIYFENSKIIDYAGDISLYLTLKLRNMYVKFTFENMLSLTPGTNEAPQYYQISGYPFRERNLRVSLSAPFIL